MDPHPPAHREPTPTQAAAPGDAATGPGEVLAETPADPIDPATASQPRKKKGRADWYQKTSAASLGIEMAIAIVLCTFAGMWLQNNVTHWQPWTMLIGFTFGVGAAVNAIIRVIGEEEAARREREAARRNADEALDASGTSTSPAEHPSGAPGHGRR
jgi:F0F1-type ATP synthase assembly protein I